MEKLTPEDRAREAIRRTFYTMSVNEFKEETTENLVDRIAALRISAERETSKNVKARSLMFAGALSMAASLDHIGTTGDRSILTGLSDILEEIVQDLSEMY